MKIYNLKPGWFTGPGSNVLLVLKLTFVLMLFALGPVSAGSNAQKITLSENNAPLEKVLKEIRKQSGYDFFYNEALLQQAKRVSIHVQNASLEEALAQSFAGQPFVYTVALNTVVINEARKPESANATPPIDVKGKV
ncbi:MAG: STN domain-containing protein, partial [Adhaeribacter sp.]